MSKTFKINMYFDEKGEELERLIKYLIMRKSEQFGTKKVKSIILALLILSKH